MRGAVGIRREDFEHGRRRLLQLLGVSDKTAAQEEFGRVVQVARHIFVARLLAGLADDFYVREARVDLEVYVSHLGRAV